MSHNAHESLEGRSPNTETPEEGAGNEGERRSAAPGDIVRDRDPAVEPQRERWLREQFEKEHQVMLAMMRLLVNGVSGEGRAMRFWRWLIDDLRSERRLLASPNPQGSEEVFVVSRIITWFRGLRRTGGESEMG